MNLRWLCLVLAAAACACGSYPKKDQAFCAGRKDSCGDINISLADGAIVFEFAPAPDQKGCCESYGWIQHIQHGGSPDWNYDNGAAGGGTTGAAPLGSPSDPTKQPQPVARPAGPGPWKENPWYGASSDPSADQDKFRRNPAPQKKIGDRPGGTGDRFRTQLVCVETGTVLYTWEWSDAAGFSGRPIRPP